GSSTRRFTLKQVIAVNGQHFKGFFCFLIAARFGHFFDLIDLLFDRLQVFQLQLSIDDLFVAYGVYRAIHMYHIIIIKTAQHMYNGIGCAYISQKLVTKALAFAGTLYKAGYVYYLNGIRNDVPGLNDLDQFGQAFIGHSDHAHIRLDGAEWKISRLRLRI